MNWEERLSGWVGRLVDIRIEDQAGEDPVAPPKMVQLHRVESAENGRMLQLYLNEKQFIYVPVFEENYTRLSEKVFESEDVQAKLIYKVLLI